MWIILLGTGLFFTIGSGFWQFRNFGKIFTETFGRLGDKDDDKGVSPFGAMATALASTAGTGNIAGVATAIAAGGPGSIFWMCLSAFLSMMIKYAEVFLAVKFRRKNPGGYYGGPMYYMEFLGWRRAPAVFSVFGLGAALGVGNLTQVNTMADACQTAFNIPPITTGLFTLVLSGAVLIGGISAIAKMSERLVPFMSVLYILLSAAVLIISRENILPALRCIVLEAFSPGAAVGGAAGYTVISAIRYGVGRGMYTNEAGLGSAPLAHACAQTNSPVRQGMWGAVEVFIDTVVLCLLSALVILCTGAWKPGSMQSLDGAALTVAGFENVLGDFGAQAVAVCTALFGFAAIVGWSFYGEQCCRYLFKKEWAVGIYRGLYIILLLPGAVMKLETVWQLSDIFNGLMALPNIAAIFVLSGTVFKGLREYSADGGIKIMRKVKF
ncbi:MAG: sodium:alanine symporter family protein [Oscillospiraceae bacterium]|nr:sodium:alanine symporter family protein [Oscillospiraceae bacterium]